MSFTPDLRNEVYCRASMDARLNLAHDELDLAEIYLAGAHSGIEQLSRRRNWEAARRMIACAEGALDELSPEVAAALRVRITHTQQRLIDADPKSRA